MRKHKGLLLLLIGCLLWYSCGMREDGNTNKLHGKILYISSPTSLSIISAEGDRVLVADAPGEILSCALSPDGERFAFIADGRLWVGETVNGQVSSTLFDPSFALGWGLEWSPDGERIAFGHIRWGHAVLTLDTGDIHYIRHPITATEDIYWLDPNRLLYSTGGDLWVYDLVQDRAEKLAFSIEETPSRQRLEVLPTPVVSHDGTRVAVLRQYNRGLQVQVYDLRNGSSLYTLTPPSSIGIAAVDWSPDDRQLVLLAVRAIIRTQVDEENVKMVNKGDILILDLSEGDSIRVGTGFGADLDWSW